LAIAILLLPLSQAACWTSSCAQEDRILDVFGSDSLTRVDEEDVMALLSLSDEELYRLGDHMSIWQLRGLDQEELRKLANLDRATLSTLGRDVKSALEGYVMIDHLEEQNRKLFLKTTQKRFASIAEEYTDLADKLETKRILFRETEDRARQMSLSKEMLLLSGRLAGLSLERLRVMAETDPNMQDGEIQELTREIDAGRNSLGSRMIELGKAEDRQDLLRGQEGLLAEWSDIRRLTMKLSHVSEQAQLERMFLEAAISEKKLDRVLMHKDTPELKEKVYEFSRKVKSARDRYEQLGKTELAGTQTIREASRELRESHQMLKELIREISEEGGRMEFDNDVEATVPRSLLSE